MYTVAPEDRAHFGTHRWMSDPAAGLPAWLELRWNEPVPVREVQLVFDTGMHRFLTLSQADGDTQRILWGQPQPEAVRDYIIEVETAAGWREVKRVVGNFQRRRVHVLESSVSVDAIRVTVTATIGLNHVRVFEVRAYA